jgi:Tfp pilus assembly protein PilV
MRRRIGENRHRNHGASLLEVVIAIFVLAVAGVSLLKTLTVATQSTFTASLGSAALYRCQEKIEEVLADSYQQIDEERYPPELDLTLDTRGTLTTEDDVLFNRVVTIADESADERSLKRVTVWVMYFFAGETATEELSTVVAKASR